MRKKRKRYKLLVPEPAPPQPPARVVAIVTIVQWTLWFALCGVLMALLLVTSLYTQLHLSPRVWLNLWPASIRLMTASGLSGHQLTHLAFRLTGENGLLYAGFGALLGVCLVAVRALRRRWS